MTEAAFLELVAPYAIPAAERAGFWPSVVLAQWADETEWGSSLAWLHGCNPAGISPGGVIASYPSIAAGADAWIATALQSDYDPVRAEYSHGNLAQALALGRSPWAAGHYIAEGSSVPGTSLYDIIEDNDLESFDSQPANPQSQLEGLFAMLQADAEFAVRYLYRFALHREVDEGGFAQDVAFLTNGGTLDSLLAQIQDSPEGGECINAERRAFGLPAL
ncbi:MAG: hypothetical protein ABSF84_02840 [Acidimicrobiales bacterium]|jgi:hypothetical protein